MEFISLVEFFMALVMFSYWLLYWLRVYIALGFVPKVVSITEKVVNIEI